MYSASRMAAARRIKSLTTHLSNPYPSTRPAITPLPAAARSASSDAKKKKPKAVIFDLGGVVLNSPLPAIHAFEKKAGLPQDSIFTAAARAGDGGAFQQLERGEIQLKECYSLLSQDLGSAGLTGTAQLSELFAEMEKSFFPPRPEMLDAIQCIRAEGIKTAALTNNWRRDNHATFPPELLPVLRLFDVVVESARIGLRKPDPEIYTATLERLKVKEAKDVIFLDDLGRNLKPAAAMGMETIKVEMDYKGALQELEARLGFPLQGYVAGTVSVRPNLKIDASAVDAYSQTVPSLAADGGVKNMRQFGHGQSNPTYHLTYNSGKEVVLRKKPPGKILRGAHAVEREFKVISALRSAGYKVPTPIALCEDEAVIGTPFYLMDFAKGQIHKNPHLKSLKPEERAAVYDAMNQVLAQLHSLSPSEMQLQEYGKSEGYFARQISTWTKQYEASKTDEEGIPSMNALIKWLSSNIPAENPGVVVHGDFRLDNIIFKQGSPEVVAVLDWELSTLGDPLADLAYNCLVYYLPPQFPQVPGFMGIDLPPGVPTEEEYVRKYCERTGRAGVEQWNFYTAFSFFRIAAILQGVYKRSTQGNASSDQAQQIGALASAMADTGYELSQTPRSIRL
mmetsp:Transcript_6598/g.15444  ORF Transcript_6598/g.15444 Transcript_6598/m.15444 type:complete len:622 (-) Transcript_6598:73-1938(-)